MPTLPISSSSGIDGGVLPVRSEDDVLAVLPAEVRRSASAPIRDGLVAALTEIVKEYQRRARRTAATLDPLRALGSDLAALAEDHEVFQQDNESTEELRARLLGVPELVTPAAIMAAVNAILAPHTPKQAKYFEAIDDRLFVAESGATWQSFLYEATAAASPHYPDRLYHDDVTENAGYEIANREVLGGWAFDDNIGRHFLLRLPQLESVDTDGSYATDAADDGMFIADGSNTAGAEADGSVASFIFTEIVLSKELYDAIVSVVQILRGQGIRWTVFVDPLL